MSVSDYWNYRLQTGTAAGTGVTAEHVKGATKAILTLASTPVTITKVSSDGYGALKIYDFPAGMIQGVNARIVSLALTAASGIGATATVSGSLGTAATANSTLSGAEVDMVPSTDVTLSSSAGTLNAEMTATEKAAAVFEYDGTAKDLYLNFALSADVTTNSTITCSGTIIVDFVNHGAV